MSEIVIVKWYNLGKSQSDYKKNHYKDQNFPSHPIILKIIKLITNRMIKKLMFYIHWKYFFNKNTLHNLMKVSSH